MWPRYGLESQTLFCSPGEIQSSLDGWVPFKTKFFSWFTAKENALALSLAFDALIYGMGIAFGILYLIREGFSYQVLREAMVAKEEIEKNEGGT